MPDHLMIASASYIAMHKNPTAMQDTNRFASPTLGRIRARHISSHTKKMKSGRSLLTGPFRRCRLFWLLGFTTETHGLCQCRACRCIVRSDHRIIRR